MAEVYTNPREKNDTNEANLGRVYVDSGIEDSVAEQLARRIAGGAGRPVAVIQMDMDKSVEIRKSGIDVKIAVLREVGELLARELGKECAVLPHGTRDDLTIFFDCGGDLEEVARFAADVLKLLADTPFGSGLENGPFHVTYSAGIAVYPAHGRTALQLLELADGAVRRAKDGGRNAYAFAEAGYGHLQRGELDPVRWRKLFALSCATGRSVEELVREGYEALFQKHAALYRFCCQEHEEVEG